MRRAPDLFAAAGGLKVEREERKATRLEGFIAHPRRAVWTLALPMMAGFGVHALYHIVDMAFIGRLGPPALAAATFVGVLFFVAIALVGGLATGITAGVARAIGRQDTVGADRFASNALGLCILVGVGLSLSGLLAGELIIPLLGAEGESIGLGWQYFRIVCLGIPLMFVSSALRAVLTGEGDARTPMVVMIMATLLNAGLDPLFIFVLDFGIQGAAMATVTAQCFAFTTFSYLVFIRHRTTARFRLSLMVPHAALLLEVLRIAIPASAGQLVMAAGRGLTNRLLAEFGQHAVAGFGAASRIDLLVSLPTLGLAAASVSVVGMFAGAQRDDLIRSTTLYSYRWAVTNAAILGIAAFLASGWVVRIFTDDPATLEVGRGYLQFMVFVYPLMGIGMVSGRVLQGLGYGMPSLVITTVRVLVAGVLPAYLAVLLFGAPIEAVWSSILLGGLVSSALALVWVRAKVWGGSPSARGSTEQVVDLPEEA